MRRFKHSLSHYRLLTGDMGTLYPVGCVEVLAGDSFQHRTSALIRLAPQIAPVMHPIQVSISHWFVPNRLIWDEWEDFITGGPDGTGPSGAYPVIDTAVAEGDLYDYLGVPVDAVSRELCALPVRAYNAVYNEFFRDQDLITEVTEDTTDLQKVAWGKDYFTSARPWTQKGPAVSVPLGGTAPVTGIGMQSDVGVSGSGVNIKETGVVDREYGNRFPAWSTSGVNVEEDPSNVGYPYIFADLSNATGTDINEFRRAFALQRYQEARARYGSRYTEYLAYLGIRASDQRLQRPEFLGGGRAAVSFSEVLQTADRSDASPTNHSALGSLGGHGISAIRSRRYRRFFEEHGWVLTLMHVRPKAMYLTGLHKKWSRRTKEDYFQKELEAIGQQEVDNTELYSPNVALGTTFGYADRYREYREEPSYVSGEFRSTLDFWHLGRDFASAPTLNQAFVECDPSKRIFASSGTDTLWMMVNHNLQARRMVNRSAHARIL